MRDPCVRALRQGSDDFHIGARVVIASWCARARNPTRGKARKTCGWGWHATATEFECLTVMRAVLLGDDFTRGSIGLASSTTTLVVATWVSAASSIHSTTLYCQCVAHCRGESTTMHASKR